MCEFVMKHYFSRRDLVQTKYKVLSFESDDYDFWVFKCKSIAEKQHSKVTQIEGSVEMWCFPKKKETGKTGNKIEYKELAPPWFMNKMRNKAIDEGYYMVQGDDSPAYTDAELFKMQGEKK